MKDFQVPDIMFVVNPYSGRKNINTIIKKINSCFPDHRIEISKSISDFKQIFLNYKDKCKVFVIVGGDGTVNTAAKEISKSENNIMAVFPSGSGNGFARELGFNKKLNSLKKYILKNEILHIDILLINETECFNVSGIGFDAYVAHDFKNRKKRGLLAYILSVITAVFKFKSFSVNFDNKEICAEDKVKMITIANTKQFGNNAIIAPNAVPYDGYYDLVIVKTFPIYYYPVFILRLMTGTLKQSKFVKYHKLNKDILISSDCDLFHIDGEPFTSEKKFKISISEHKLPVIKTGK